MFKGNQNHTQQGLFDSSEWMNPKIKKKLMKSWAPIFYEHVFSQINEAPFAVLYGTTGAPNFPVNILLSLEYIKHMKNNNDIELLDDFYFDYLVNYAVGIRTLGEKNLSERTLYYFRERIYKHCIENPGSDELLFGQFIKLLKEFANKANVTLDEQRTDTTYFMSNIKKAGRMSLAYDVLQKAINAIPKEKLSEALNEAMEPDFKTNVLYRAKSCDSESRLTMLLNLCNEACQILKGLSGKQTANALRIAERFLVEQSTDIEGGRKIPKPKNEIASGSLQSAHDEEATFRRKGNEAHSGYVLEISETCGGNNAVQFITDYTVEANKVSDVEIFQGRIQTIRENTGCTDMYVDGGFHSDDVHRLAEENGIKIHLTNMSGTAPTKKFAITEFDIDEATNIIKKCPGGQTPVRTGTSKSQASAHFPHEVCDNCPRREHCHSKKQVKDYVVRISLRAISVGRERLKMKEHRMENTGKRAGIEGSNSALKRTGLNKLDVRGIIKSTMVCGLKVTAQNIKRFTKFMQGYYKPKNAIIYQQGILAPIFN